MATSSMAQRATSDTLVVAAVGIESQLEDEFGIRFRLVEPGAQPSTVRERYYMALTETTQQLWNRFSKHNPSKSVGDASPVESVTFHQVTAFFDSLNSHAQANLIGHYRLPTEAEWQYAAQGGHLSSGFFYAGGNAPSAVAWHGGTIGDPSPVARKLPNELGLFDMSGNVWEWTSLPMTDIREAVPAGTQIIRGGGYASPEAELRIDARGGFSEDDGTFDLGFRIVLDPVASQQTEAPPDSFETPDDDGEVRVVLEVMPQLIGGLRWLQSQIRYPNLAKQLRVEGRVVVQFVVDIHGAVEDVRVVRGIGGGCDEEAVRVVMGARFTPGLQDGEPVRVKISLPVTFRLRR